MEIKEALEKFRNGYNCSQVVFSACSDKLGIDIKDALRIASGFGAGMARFQNTCGAVTGAFMLLGCKYSNPDAADSNNVVYQYIKDFSNKFIEHNNTINCKELLECNLNTEAGQAFFKENNLKEVKCVKYIKDAIRIVEKMLDL